MFKIISLLFLFVLSFSSYGKDVSGWYMNTGQYYLYTGAASTLLPDNTVLTAGGYRPNSIIDSCGNIGGTGSEIYDPSTNIWTKHPMPYPMSNVYLMQYKSLGKDYVLAVGNSCIDNSTFSEIYDVANKRWKVPGDTSYYGSRGSQPPGLSYQNVAWDNRPFFARTIVNICDAFCESSSGSIGAILFSSTQKTLFYPNTNLHGSGSNSEEWLFGGSQGSQLIDSPNAVSLDNKAVLLVSDTSRNTCMIQSGLMSCTQNYFMLNALYGHKYVVPFVDSDNITKVAVWRNYSGTEPDSSLYDPLNWEIFTPPTIFNPPNPWSRQSRINPPTQRIDANVLGIKTTLNKDSVDPSIPLKNGIFYVGGRNVDLSPNLSCDIYDAQSKVWNYGACKNLNQERVKSSLVQLSSSSFIIIGGISPSSAATSEIYYN